MDTNNNILNRKELVDLVHQILNSENKTEEEINELILKFKRSVPHPSPTNLIYWEDLTPEEVVAKALNYKAIQL